MTLVIGIVHLLTGGAYLFLMGLSIHEQRRPARITPFSAALTVMFSGCTMHHLLHAEHALIVGQRADPIVLPGLIMAGIPSAVFLLLRLEAMRGGVGDRVIVGTPAWVGLVPMAAALLVGVVLTPAVAIAVRDGWDTAGVVSNLVLLGTYSMVGWYLVRGQIARRPLRGGWSLSGLSLAAIFPLCAVAHVVGALVTPADLHTLGVALYQAPASIFFLLTVRRLHQVAYRHLNRRPAVGRPARARRTSPWDGRGAPVSSP